MAKAYDYVITLKQRNFKAFDWVSQLLIFLSLAVFAYEAYLYPEIRIVFGIFGVLIIGSWIYTLYRSKDTSVVPYFRLTLTLTSVVWFTQNHGNPWIGGLLVLIAFLERPVKFPEEVGFSEEGIIFNSFPKKELSWSDVSNAVLKDGLLTIDKKNNRLFQKEVEHFINPALEIEFNSFCKNMLSNQNSTAQA